MHTSILPPSSVTASKPLPELAVSRIPFIDIVRGYALFGIFLVRMVEVYSGWNTEMAASLPTAATDNLLHQLVIFIAANKFRGLFSLLFGLSFYLQLQKAEQKGQSFQQNFLRRLGVLFVFGLLHAYLLWSGDILRWYAIAGLVVLLLYKLSPKALFLIGLSLTIVPVVAEDLLHDLGILVHQASAEEALAVHTLTSTSSYWTMLQANVIIVNAEWLNIGGHIGHVLPVAGYFLLGIWLGKLQLWMPEQWKKQYVLHKKELKKLGIQSVIFAGLIAVGTVAILYFLSIPLKSLFAQGGIGRMIIYHAKTPVIVAGHVLFLYVLTQVKFLFKTVEILSYAGRMTLTHYILQSVIGIAIFYGIGLGFWGKIGPTYTVPITIGLFIAQVLLSKLYLSYFTTGPLEYIWRLLLGNSQKK